MRRIRVSDHAQRHSEGTPVSLDLVVPNPTLLASEEARFLVWIEDNYGFPKVQKA
jgi:hypothetical protein